MEEQPVMHKAAAVMTILIVCSVLMNLLISLIV
jgi:hypothetical protein